ncbi:MAG: hypothetical protein WKF59_17820 [Chitinophagaceae bacterium]
MFLKTERSSYLEAYGKMSREYNLDNIESTKFFLASTSMIFTSCRNYETLWGRENYYWTTRLSKFIPDYKQGNEITIHDLLALTFQVSPAIGTEANVNYDKYYKV